MSEPRLAVQSDAIELTRLHVEAGLGRAVDDAWRITHQADLARCLQAADPHLVGFVIDAPPTGELACAAVGFVHDALSRPGNPGGLVARLSSLTTHPPYRRRGLATATVSAFLREFLASQMIRRLTGTTLVDLRAELGLTA
jgi:GNAT superfamily N-acetyltransferase